MTNHSLDLTKQLDARDVAADGICCSQSSGRGSYSLYLGDASEPDNLVRTGGDYGSGETFLFEVREDSTYPPTMSPTGRPRTLAPTTGWGSTAPTTYWPTSSGRESFWQSTAIDRPADGGQVIAAATDVDGEKDETTSSSWGARGPGIVSLLGVPLLMLGGVI